MSEAYLIGGGQIHCLIGESGATPPCPEAKFKRGDVVKVRRNQAVGHFPEELVVLVAIPPGFSPDDAMADLVGRPVNIFFAQAQARKLLKELKAKEPCELKGRVRSPADLKCYFPNRLP